MADDTEERHILYSPDSPGDGDVTDEGDRKRATKDQKTSDRLAANAGIGDELSAYEKVAGRGVAEE